MASTIQTSGELKSRMTSLEKSLGSHARSASFGAGMTLLLGVVLIAGLGFYFWYGFNVIGGFLSEKKAASNILDVIETQLNDNLDPARKYLETVVKENAPAWAEMASNSIVDGVPAAREHAVSMAVTGFEQSMAESNKHAQEMVSAYIRKNDAKIKEAVKHFSGTPAEADQFLADLKNAFDKEVEVDIDSSVKQVVDFVEGFNGLLAKTKNESVRMTNLQAMQREILMLVKRALMDQAPTLPLAKS